MIGYCENCGWPVAAEGVTLTGSDAMPQEGASPHQCDDASCVVSQSLIMAQVATVDRLDTGEDQPRLPGDVGAVRDQEVAQPLIMAPVDHFDLTPPEATSHTQPGIPFDSPEAES